MKLLYRRHVNIKILFQLRESMSSVKIQKIFLHISKIRMEQMCTLMVAQAISGKVYVCVGGQKIHVTFSRMECAYSHHTMQVSALHAMSQNMQYQLQYRDCASSERLEALKAFDNSCFDVLLNHVKMQVAICRT